MTSVAVCEAKQIANEDVGSHAAVRAAICEETVLLAMLDQAEELDEAPMSASSNVLRQVIGLSDHVNRLKGTIYYSERSRMRGRHERPRHGRHALGRSLMRHEAIVRPTLPVEKHAPRHAKRAPEEVLAAKQQHTVLLPHVARHRAVAREARTLSGGWRTAVAGLGAAAVACTGMSIAMAKDGEGGLDRPQAFSFPWQSVNTPPGRADVVVPSNAPSRPSRASADRSRDASHTPKTAASDMLVQDKTLTAAQKVTMRNFADAITAVPAADLKGVCAPALLAKAVIVSNWGESSAAKKHNNPFGLSNGKGQAITYASLSHGLAAQARRIKASPYYGEPRLFPGQAADSCAANGRTFLLSTKTHKEARINMIFSFFAGDLEAVETAGLVGNSEWESGVNEKRVQTVGGSAKGLMQWEGNRFAPKPGRPSRTLGLKAFAARAGKPWTNFRVQLEYIKYEFLHHEKRAYRKLKAADTPTEASVAVTDWYERPSRNPKTLHMKERIKSSNQAYTGHVMRQKQTQNATGLMKKQWFGGLFSKRANAA